MTSLAVWPPTCSLFPHHGAAKQLYAPSPPPLLVPAESNALSIKMRGVRTRTATVVEIHHTTS